MLSQTLLLTAFRLLPNIHTQQGFEANYPRHLLPYSRMNLIWKTIKSDLFKRNQWKHFDLGVGYRFRFVLPWSIELKGVVIKTPEKKMKLIGSPNLKLFIPLSSGIWGYGKFGIPFVLNDSVDNYSDIYHWAPIQKSLCNGMSNLLEQSPKANYQSCMLMFGYGFIFFA